VIVGVRMALERGRGRTAVPVRPAIAGAVAGVLGVVAATVVATSLERVVAEPARYGWTFDTVVVGSHGQTGHGGPCGPQRSPVEQVGGVEAVGSICSAAVVVGTGKPVNAFGYRSIRGRLAQPVVRGRAPRTDREVALGEQTLDRIGAGLGDHVRVTGGHGHVDARVVGTAIFPSLEDPTPLAEGALLTPAALTRIATDNDSSYNHLVVRWKPGTDVGAGSLRLARISGQRPNQPVPPLEVRRLEQLDTLPWILAGFLALLALVTVAQAVVTNARRRRTEFALLRTLGLRGRQLRTTVDTQAVTLAVVGLAFGIPLGIVTGRWFWGLVAHDIGVATDAAVPPGLVLVLVPGVIALVLAIAFYPARSVARSRPAVALRSE
jgi:predicted lysophospholipase L1 biosynthesis ABC-type transport system permease subunit